VGESEAGENEAKSAQFRKMEANCAPLALAAEQRRAARETEWWKSTDVRRERGKRCAVLQNAGLKCLVYAIKSRFYDAYDRI